MSLHEHAKETGMDALKCCLSSSFPCRSSKESVLADRGKGSRLQASKLWTSHPVCRSGTGVS